MSRYLDLEAAKSGSGHTTEEDDDNDHSVDDIFDTQPDDDIVNNTVDEHRQVNNELDKAEKLQRLQPLRRTDSDQRNFLRTAHNDMLAPASPISKRRKSPTPVTFNAPAVRVDLIRLAAEEQERQHQAEEELNESVTQVFDDACANMSTASQDSQHCHHIRQPTDKEIDQLYQNKLHSQEDSQYDTAMADLDEHLSQTRRDTSSSSGTTTTTTCTTTPTPNTTEPQVRGKFCLRHKKIGLTYPNCELSQMYVTDWFRTCFSNYEPKLIIVSAEQAPTTDGRHLHAYIEFAKTFNSNNNRCFDIPNNNGGMFHPNIRTVTNSKQWITYVTKGGNIYVYPQTARALYEPTHLAHYFNEQQHANKHATITGQLVEDIKKGSTFSELLRRYPGYMILHSRVVKQFIYMYQTSMFLEQQTKKWKTVTKFEGFNIESMAIAGWLNDHLLKPHTFRSHCLWIKGPTQCGKTSLVEMLRNNGCIICNVDLSTHFYEDLDDDTQLLVFDEFKAQKTITEMNKMCDGSRSTVDTKNGHFNITKPMPVIVLSNFSIEEAYHNSDQLHLKTLIGRFLFIDMKDLLIRVQPCSMQE